MQNKPDNMLRSRLNTDKTRRADKNDVGHLTPNCGSNVDTIVMKETKTFTYGNRPSSFSSHLRYVCIKRPTTITKTTTTSTSCQTRGDLQGTHDLNCGK